MERVEIVRAKARLSELVAKAECGQEIAITRGRKVVALLVPATKRIVHRSNSSVIDRITAFSKALQFKKGVNSGYGTGIQKKTCVRRRYARLLK